jgi:hypothetical protein
MTLVIRGALRLTGKGREILDELKAVVTGKTFDALLPPLIFVIVNSIAGLEPAALAAVACATALGLIRLLRGQSWNYAFGGLVAVLLAAALAYLTRSAAGYFIPAIAGSALLLAAALISLFMGKPLAAWASHLTRGWPLDWFWRRDIKPAYVEVTWFWTLILLARLIVQVILYQAGDITRLAWANILLGWPVTIVILIATYLYGIWRLRRLGGPGVDEFKAEKEPPWLGQRRGF